MAIKKSNMIPLLTQHTENDFYKAQWGVQPLYTNEGLRQWFHINRLEEIYQKRLHFTMPVHQKIFHDFIYLKTGTIRRSKGVMDYEMSAGKIFFLPAFHLTSNADMSADATGFYCQFNPQLFDFLPSGYLINRFAFLKENSFPVVELAEDSIPEVENSLELLHLNYQKDTAIVRKQQLAFYLLALLEGIRLNEYFQDKKLHNSYQTITARYRELLPRQIYNFRSISEFADYMNVTPNYLNKCVRKVLNRTAHDLLGECMIEESQKLLRFSGLTISEIAARLSDQSPSNFTRFFKAKTGMTPKEYLQSLN